MYEILYAHISSEYLIIRTTSFLCRNDGEGRIVAVVSEEDRPLQERQCSKLPHEVRAQSLAQVYSCGSADFNLNDRD